VTRRLVLVLALVVALCATVVATATADVEADVGLEIRLPLPALPLGPGPLYPLDAYGPGPTTTPCCAGASRPWPPSGP
jgi:hypothetical protein